MKVCHSKDVLKTAQKFSPAHTRVATDGMVRTVDLDHYCLVTRMQWLHGLLEVVDISAYREAS